MKNRDYTIVSQLIPFLEQNGFDYLTSEADPFGMRLLFDVSPDAQQHWQNFQRVRNAEFEDARNHRAPWKSVLIPRNVLTDLVVYLLLTKHGHKFVVQVEGSLYATANKETAREIMDTAKDNRHKVGRTWDHIRY